MMILEVIDRSTGEVEKIPESDGNFEASIARCADANGMAYEEALEVLMGGAELHTSGFIRRLRMSATEICDKCGQAIPPELRQLIRKQVEEYARSQQPTKEQA